MNARWNELDEWLAEQLVEPGPEPAAALEASVAAGLPRHEVSPLQGRLLELLVRICGARRVLELGTLGGYSTIWLARGLPDGGRVVSLEADAGYAAVARANLERAGAGDRVEVIAGPALETLPRLEGPFDLVFLDADKRLNPEYLDWALRLARPGTVLVADNIARDGRVLDPPEGDETAAGMRRFLELAGAEPRLEATAIQTVGAKGWDGFLLARVRDP